MAATIIPSPTRLKENITLKFKNMKVAWHMIFFPWQFLLYRVFSGWDWVAVWNETRLFFSQAALLMNSEFVRFLYIVHNALCYVSFMNYVFCYYIHYFRMQLTRKSVCSGTCSMRGKYSLIVFLPFFFIQVMRLALGWLSWNNVWFMLTSFFSVWCEHLYLNEVKLRKSSSKLNCGALCSNFSHETLHAWRTKFWEIVNACKYLTL